MNQTKIPIAHRWVTCEVVKHPRTENQINQAVRQLEKKLRGRNSWRGIPTRLYNINVTRGPGSIRVTFAQPDNTLTGQPDVILAAIEMHQDATAVDLYREGRKADGQALHNEIMFTLGHTDPAKHSMPAAWRMLVDLHADLGAPGYRADWTDREILEWIAENHGDGVRALEALETQEAASARLNGPTVR